MHRAALAAAALLFVAAPALAQEPVPSEPIPVVSDTTEAIADSTMPEPYEGQVPPGVEVRETEPWLFETTGFWGFSAERYNRVDGLVPAWGFQLEPVDPARQPAFEGRIARATTHDRYYWSLVLRQRLPLPGALVVRFEYFQRAATFDDWKVWGRENDISSFVSASDQLDWWRETGLELAFDAESSTGRLAGTLAYVDVDQHSEPNRSPFSLFGGDEDWRPNPAVEEGRLRALRIDGRFDTRDVQSPLLPSPGWSVRATWELAGALGGDVEFSRASLDVRRYTRLGRDAWWDSRIVWMGPLGDENLPPQREVKLGGPGSLRGFRAVSFQGDAGVQAQTELRLPLPVTDRIALLFLSWHAVGFLDAGTVEVDDAWEDVHADVGLGVSGINIFSYVGLFVAQRITDRGGDADGPRFVVRLRRDF